MLLLGLSDPAARPVQVLQGDEGFCTEGTEEPLMLHCADRWPGEPLGPAALAWLTTASAPGAAKGTREAAAAAVAGGGGGAGGAAAALWLHPAVALEGKRTLEEAAKG